MLYLSELGGIRLYLSLKRRSFCDIDSFWRRIVCPARCVISCIFSARGGWRMEDDQGSGKRDISDESGCETNSLNIGNITRRELLVGGASTLVASQAFAAGQKLPYLDIFYEDATRRGLVIAWVESAISRYEWHLSASTFAET